MTNDRGQARAFFKETGTGFDKKNNQEVQAHSIKPKSIKYIPGGQLHNPKE